MFSDEFHLGKEVLAAKREELSAQGYGNKPNRADPLTEKDEQQLWGKGHLGFHTPQALLNTVW